MGLLATRVFLDQDRQLFPASPSPACPGLAQYFHQLPDAARVEALPLPRPPSADDPSWLQNLQLTLGLMSIPSGVIGAGDIAIRLIERGEERVNALMQAAGVPGADDTAVANDPRQALDTFKTAWGADIAAKLRGLPGGASAADALFPAVGAALARETLLRARPMVALLRARQAERLGWDSTADQWYRTSLEHSAKAGAANRWLEILILHSWGKRAQAQAALQRAVQERLVPDHQLAALAVRLRDYATARTLFASLAAPEGGDWRDAADRAEVALENGDGAAALALVSCAIATFESFVDHLARDADRVSACDDVNAAALYLLASRIHLRLAQGNGAAERARAFEVVDRHRALALPPDVPRAKAEALRQWQQAATEHATAYQRLLAALTLGTGDVPALRDTLAGAERALADIEAQLTPEQQIAVALARRVRAFTAQDAQRLLPANACLIEYQVVARDYIIFAVTGTQLVAHEGRLEHGTFEGMTSRFVRACATGAPSPEAEDLAAVLLAPFGEILARHERVIIVPSGALNAVPFHVLPLQGKPLGETHVVSYLPAATLLLRGAVDRPLAAAVRWSSAIRLSIRRRIPRSSASPAQPSKRRPSRRCMTRGTPMWVRRRPRRPCARCCATARCCTSRRTVVSTTSRRTPRPSCSRATTSSPSPTSSGSTSAPISRC